MSPVSAHRSTQKGAADRARKSISPPPAATESNRRPGAPPRKTARVDAKTKRACSLLKTFCRERWRAENQLRRIVLGVVGQIAETVGDLAQVMEGPPEVGLAA